MNASSGSAPAGGLGRAIGGVAVLILAAIALYYLYEYLFATSGTEYKVLVTDALKANPPVSNKLYTIPQINEGGEYSISFWVYITGFKDQVGLNKHVLELRGPTFSTLVVGLGAFTNKLFIRTSTETRGASLLTNQTVRNMFSTTQIPGSTMGDQGMPLCDLPEVDLQRWVCISIVLNGKTTDVYYDGKLARSCVTPGFFRVDKGGVSLKLTDRGGFDGFISDVVTYKYALNPEEVYRIYMAGPSDVKRAGFMAWLRGLFNLQGTLTYQYPALGVSFPTGEVTF